jgi:hypothetical protein
MIIPRPDLALVHLERICAEGIHDDVERRVLWEAVLALNGEVS